MDAEQRVQVGRVSIAVLAAHFGPVGVQLLGQDHRQAGLHALAEFEPVDGDRDPAVGRDLHEGQGLFGRLEAGGCRGGLRSGQVREGAQRKAAGAHHFEEAAAWQGGGCVSVLALQHVLQGARQLDRIDVIQHGVFLQAMALAASVTAARMRA
ncbi:hypothetical protein D9M68_787850 [compost metagenome]